MLTSFLTDRYFYPNVLLAALTTLLFRTSSSLECYSCDGTCYSNNDCNCQTGYCEGRYCMSSRHYESHTGYNIMKGCANRMPTDQVGCFYDFSHSKVVCYCEDADYCNEEVNKPSLSALPVYSCHKCSDTRAGKCHTCSDGNYCELNLLRHISSCEHGHPRLPFVFSTGALLNVASAQNSAVCASLREGTEQTTKLCVCASNMCNTKAVLKSGDVAPPARNWRATIVCAACMDSGFGAINTATCREHTCTGHFCTLNVRTFRSLKSGIVYERSAGCLNITRPELVHTGCVHQWSTDRHELVQCVCRSSYCNRSIVEAGANSNLSNSNVTALITIFCLLVHFSSLREFK